MAKIASGDDLKRSVEIVNEELQKIQDYLGRDKNKDGKISFPKRFIRTTNEHLLTLPHLDNEPLMVNIAHTAMMNDVLRWLIIRTDIWSIAKTMIVKTAIILLVSMMEAVVRGATKKMNYDVLIEYKKHQKRVQLLCSKKIISEEIKDSLIEAWRLRGSIHIPDDGRLEKDCYDVDHYNKILRTYERLNKNLKEYFESKSI